MLGLIDGSGASIKVSSINRCVIQIMQQARNGGNQHAGVIVQYFCVVRRNGMSALR
jgi:hypothetical protein